MHKAGYGTGHRDRCGVQQGAGYGAAHGARNGSAHRAGHGAEWKMFATIY